MDIAGNRLRRRFHPIRSDVFSLHRSYFSTDLISSIYSALCKGCDLLCKHRKRALAVFFLMLEAMSFLLDVSGKSRRSILLTAFLLSTFGFVMTIATCILERTRVQAEKQLGVVEVLFSVVQLIATFLAVLGIKIIKNYTTSILLLVFAVIAVVFVSRKDENIFYSSTLTNDYETELISTIVHNFPQTPPYSLVDQQLDYDNELLSVEVGNVSDTRLEQQLNDHTQSVSELNRMSSDNKKLTEMVTDLRENYNILQMQNMDMSSENKQLTEMVTELRENYNILQMQNMDLMSKSNTENQLTTSKNRKAVVVQHFFIPRSDFETSPIANDDYEWRTRRQKFIRAGLPPKVYFRCSFAPSCPVKKRVQSTEDQSFWVVSYEGEHNHQPPY